MFLLLHVAKVLGVAVSQDNPAIHKGRILHFVGIHRLSEIFRS